MAKCDNCGNDYKNSFQILIHGKQHIFDSFECAINVLAPKCGHCNTQIIGHGLESSGKFFCCAHCAKSSGVQGFKDHLD